MKEKKGGNWLEAWTLTQRDTLARDQNIACDFFIFFFLTHWECSKLGP